MNIPQQAMSKGLLGQMSKMRSKAGSPVLEEVTAQIIRAAPKIALQVPQMVPQAVAPETLPHQESFG